MQKNSVYLTPSSGMAGLFILSINSKDGWRTRPYNNCWKSNKNDVDRDLINIPVLLSEDFRYEAGI
ncbi:MAG: hypothetical protein ACRC62_25925 [Microcoleus sp.]